MCVLDIRHILLYACVDTVETYTANINTSRVHSYTEKHIHTHTFPRSGSCKAPHRVLKYVRIVIGTASRHKPVGTTRSYRISTHNSQTANQLRIACSTAQYCIHSILRPTLANISHIAPLSELILFSQNSFDTFEFAIRSAAAC